MSNDSSKSKLAKQPVKSLDAEAPTVNQQVTSKSVVPWSPFVGVLYAAFIYFAAQFFASAAVALFAHSRGWSSKQIIDWLNHSLIAQFWYVAATEALTFGAILWFLRQRKSSLQAIGFRKPILKDIAYALSGFAVYFAIYIVALGLINSLIPSINLNQQQDTGFQNAHGSLNLVLTFVSLVVLPPIVEEIVFRGFIFSGLKNKLPVIYAAIGTSLLFASAHLQFGTGKPLLWIAAVDTFTLSMVLCYVRQKSDSIMAGMCIHALKNGIAFFALFIVPLLH